MLNTNKWIAAVLMLYMVCFACTKKNIAEQPITETQPDTFIRGADLSFLPEIESTGTIFYNRDNTAKDVLSIVKENGCNTIRIRLWYAPAGMHSNLPEVKILADRVKATGLKVWLDMHYSDTWADPGAQAKPQAWVGASFQGLQDSLYNYTRRAVQQVAPDYVQVGNEINDGFLWPDGRISVNVADFLVLLKKGCQAVRDAGNAKIIIHYAGINGATAFYDRIRTGAVDYDLMGLSYYPMFHGLNLQDLKTGINSLIADNNKPLVIAETGYPFTLGYNDQTNNILGLASQTIPDYPATSAGQKAFLLALKDIVRQNSKGAGICYWAPDWVAFKGPLATDGSSWENQALFDFSNKALEAMDVFNP